MLGALAECSHCVQEPASAARKAAAHSGAQRALANESCISPSPFTDIPHLHSLLVTQDFRSGSPVEVWQADEVISS